MLHKLLCVDDDPITLMLYKMVIAKAEFAEQVDTAQNGEEAIAYFDGLLKVGSDYPKLIFLDLNMPVMGGWEFLDLFSTPKYEAFSDAKVIVLSSTIDPQDIEKSKSYKQVIDFRSKPISKEMLAELQHIF
ncbi:response regulator [Flavobacterium sp. MAH-1]|uniref:Response regulator n=1 Tax=Flavobacterium agri TaxID=2743471 RepID=A0A7Y9C5M6_9FLAO|nr:response regulator [Flavobacterium agri]NUY81136.1 response regulator [Flavobacterium agri]NYA71160.1 response regulator [Flavobacterium agri]